MTSFASPKNRAGAGRGILDAEETWVRLTQVHACARAYESAAASHARAINNTVNDPRRQRKRFPGVTKTRSWSAPPIEDPPPFNMRTEPYADPRNES